MTYKRTSPVLFVAVMTLVLANTALANTVKMKYEYQNQHYYFSINNSSTLTSLMCDSYDNTIHRGETWTATKSPFLAGIANSMFGPSMTMDYKAAGLIYKGMMSGALTTLQAQWAVWGLFSTNARNNPMFAEENGAATDTAYLAMVLTAKNSAYNGLVLYTPLNPQVGSGPQEFIGFSTVPEPGSLTLLGTGLVGLAFAIRRKFAKA